MKTISKISVLAILLVSATTHAGGPKEEEMLEKVFPSFNSGVVVQGAVHTWRNYLEWWNKTRGTPLRGDVELGTNLWAEGIARLKPEYVYTHGVNIVIVRSCHGEDEEGFYVALTIPETLRSRFVSARRRPDRIWKEQLCVTFGGFSLR
jgi:hypothetical protein